MRMPYPDDSSLMMRPDDSSQQGGFTSGGGNETRLRAGFAVNHLADAGKRLVVVTLNYRLGIFVRQLRHCFWNFFRAFLSFTPPHARRVICST